MAPQVERRFLRTKELSPMAWESSPPVVGEVEWLDNRVQRLVFNGDVDLCSILHTHTVVVGLALNGCDKSVRVEAVFGRLRAGNGALTVALWIDNSRIHAEPGFVDPNKLSVKHTHERSPIDGKMTTLTRIVIPGRIPLPLAWPGRRARTERMTPLPTLARPLRLVRPRSTRFVAKALQRYIGKATDPSQVAFSPVGETGGIFSPDPVLRCLTWRAYNTFTKRRYWKDHNAWIDRTLEG